MSKIISLLVFAALLGGCQTVGAQPSILAPHARVSWYSYGSRTANGDRFNPYGRTVAHKTLPFGTELKLTNPSNGRSVTVTVNDRGPFVRGRDLDVTKGVAIELGFIDKGSIVLNVQLIKLGY